jgi:hypothetical protein
MQGMHNPPHPGKVLREHLHAINISSAADGGRRIDDHAFLPRRLHPAFPAG